MKKTKKTKFVVVNNDTYGKPLRGVRIFYEGKRPKSLAKNGKINFGKNILEILIRKFDKFQWIITKDTDVITKERNIYKVRTSLATLNKVYGEQIERNRDIKIDII